MEIAVVEGANEQEGQNKRASTGSPAGEATSGRWLT